MLFRSNDTATTEIYTPTNTLSLHDALPISVARGAAKEFREADGPPLPHLYRGRDFDHRKAA